MRLPEARVALVAAATALLMLFGIARRLDPLPEGLRATYFSDVRWSSSPVVSIIDSAPSTESITSAWSGNPPAGFSTTWAGSFFVLRPDTYTFGTRSDDGSTVYVDGRLVVENGGRHEARLATGSLHLERGVHEIFVKYFQDRDKLHFELLSARDGDPLASMPSWMLFPRHVEFSRTLASVFVRCSERAALALWLAILLFAGYSAAWRPIARAATTLLSDPVRIAVAAIVVASVALNATALWWGIPSFWAGDETTPKAVLIGLSEHFMRGWYDRYPPLHFYVLSALFSPWLLLQSHGWIQMSFAAQEVVFLVISRLLSVAAAAGTLIALYRCGSEAFGRRAGLFAAATLALVAPFVYYAKTANPEVPYLFWAALSMLFYVRFSRTLSTRDLALFASAAILAICTKDQAYALYLVTPFTAIHQLWESNRAHGVAHPIRRAIVDRRLWIAGAVAAALFAACHLLPFNLDGFVSHVRYIAGPGSQPYRLVAPTLSGRLALVWITAQLVERSFGWPLFIVSMLGFVVALSDRQTRRPAMYLALMAVSYYAGFIDVILYNYDRYVLPICLVQALFAGVAIDRWLARSAGTTSTMSPWRLALVSVALAYSVLYASTVDVLMLRDSRYTAERWLRGHAGSSDLIGTAFPLVVLPRLGDFESVGIGSIKELEAARPRYFILNVDYARAVASEQPLGQLVSGLQRETLGYHIVFRYRSPAPWPWLPGGHPDLVGPRLENTSFSFLRSINPTIEIYQLEKGEKTTSGGAARSRTAS
jgi:hypothetical protein